MSCCAQTTLVQELYGRTAVKGPSPASAHIAHAFGYDTEELLSVADANMGLGCGNPTATAGLKLGEVVLDLGSGGGLDVFLAADKVGKTGTAIGVDMTPDMIALADRNLLRRPQLKNVEFRLGSITALPVSDASVDCAISNCVLNLVPAEEKQQAMREIARVLKSGGRVAISDLLAKASMPDEVKKDIGALVGCISGTVTVDHMTALLREAGFQGIVIVPTGADINVYKADVSTDKDKVPSCCTQQPVQEVATGGIPSMPDYDLNELVGAYRIYALKP